MPEGLREALGQFRDRFACNNISGCAAERALHDFGWQARPLVQQIFDRAPEQSGYRSRAVRVVAELADPQGREFLRARLTDTDPEVRAYAIYGLGLIDDRTLQPALATIARDDPSAWMAPVRLSALWLAQRWGDATAARAFIVQLGLLAEQHLAVTGLVWGLTLCGRGDGLDCSRALPAVARHPNFQVRRAVARAMAAAPLPSHAAGLVGLTAESAHSISDAAESGLRLLSGLDLHGHAAWAGWCAANQCERAADDAVRALHAEATRTSL